MIGVTIGVGTSTGITGSPLTIQYTTVAGDTPTTMATGLAAAINANAALQAANISATSAGAVITIIYPNSLSITFSEQVNSGSSTETITLASGATGTMYGMALTSIFTGSGANPDTWAISAGSNSTSGTPTWRLTLQHAGYPAEIYDNLGAGLTGAALWNALVSAVNSGCPSTYGQPSQIMIATRGTSLATPTAASGVLSGGSDGATTLTSSVFMGTDSYPRTGIYAFRGSGVSDLAVMDFDDVTQESALQLFGQSEGIYVHTNGEPGETAAEGQTNKQTQGSYGDNYAWLKRYLGDWCYYNDNYNNVQRLLAPSIFGIARISTLQPQQAGTNKQTPLVAATQRSKSLAGPYGSDELGVLSAAGIDVICNPIPAGTMFGLRNGFTASGTVETRTDNWPRLTSFIARSLAGPGAVGSLIGLDITPDYFVTGQNLLDAFFANLMDPGPGSKPVIQNYQVTFNRAGNNNPQSQTSRGVVVAQVLVQFFGIALVFLVNMETGATVVIPASGNVASASAALAAG